MNNSRFWNQNLNITGTSEMKSTGTHGKSKSLMKGVGTTGLILLVIAGIVVLLGYIFIAAPALSLVSSASAIKKDGNAIVTSFKDRDLVSMDKSLTKMESDLKQLKEDREKKFGWAKNVGLFKINEFYSDSDRLLTAGFDSILAIREIENVIKPFADAAGLRVNESEQVQQEQGLMEAFQSWVSIMPQVAGQMDGVIQKVAKIGEDIEPIDTSKYPNEINGVVIKENLDFLKNTLSQADEYGPDIKQALLIFPRVLAIGTPEKRYMVIMQNDKEIRATGGFMTNYATFKINNGLLQSDFTSKDMYSVDLTLDAIDATTDFGHAPDAYTKHLLVERWYARDMNYSPDFVISMDQFYKYYKWAGTINPTEIKPVDGIVAIDTQVISELLEVTGPVTLNGVTYNKDNVVLELEKIASLELREQVNRKRVLGDLMEAMLVNVFNSDKNLWPKIINKGVDLALRKHIQAYIFDTDAEVLIEKYGFGGRIVDPVKGDYSMVVSTNLGGDKTNWFTNKTVDHSIANENGKWVDTVKITYNYTQPAAEYQPFVKRFKDWVRVYAPAGSTLINVDGSAEDSMSDQERGKVWFSGYVELGPGETKTITFKYSLPNDVVSGDNYTLYIEKQAGIDKESHTITANGKTEKIDLIKDTTVNIKLK
jgi:hypothetical protein